MMINYRINFFVVQMKEKRTKWLCLATMGLGLLVFVITYMIPLTNVITIFIALKFHFVYIKAVVH